jgi:hypothetical protein
VRLVESMVPGSCDNLPCAGMPSAKAICWLVLSRVTGVYRIAQAGPLSVRRRIGRDEDRHCKVRRLFAGWSGSYEGGRHAPQDF